MTHCEEKELGRIIIKIVDTGNWNEGSNPHSYGKLKLKRRNYTVYYKHMYVKLDI